VECYEHRSSRPIGLPAPTTSSRFPTARWSSLDAVPRSFAEPGSSSYGLCLPFRVRRCLSPARHAMPGAFPGVCLPFATRAYGVHLPPGFPGPTTFRPQRFSRSRRLPPPCTARACFIPLPRPGFTLQGVSPLPSRLASSTSRALMTLPRFLSRRVAPPLPCPPGSPSGRWSEQRSVAASRGFSPANLSIPSCAFSSLGPSSACLGGAFTSPPLMTFRVVRSLYPQRRAFSVSIGNQPDGLSPDHLPVRAS
jgi:hypothetical protein